MSLEKPHAFFTVDDGSNAASVKILMRMREDVLKSALDLVCEVEVFKTAAEAYLFSSPHAVAVFDGRNSENGFYKPSLVSELKMSQKPDWIGRSSFAVIVLVKPPERLCLRGAAHDPAEVYDWRISTCSYQLRAMFIRNFDREAARGNLPWGNPKGKKTPQNGVVRHWSRFGRMRGKSDRCC